jgi:hypothetical protein
MKKLIFSLVFVLVATLGCSGNLTSQGDSLDEINKDKAKAEGKTYSLTLSQINIERGSEGAYVRLFDKAYNTIFVYVTDKQKNKILNLDVNGKYIYKFTVNKGGSYSTLSGTLLEVAALDVKPISGSTVKDISSNPKAIVLDGPAAVGKNFTMELVFKDLADESGKKIAAYNSADAYESQVFCEVPADQLAKVEKFKAAEKHKVTFKVDRVDWRVFATLVSAE